MFAVDTLFNIFDPKTQIVIPRCQALTKKWI